MGIRSKLRHLRLLATDPRWIGFYAQRRILDPSRRAKIAEWIARRRGGWGQVGNELTQTGQLELGQVLTASQCAELRGYFENIPVVDNYRPSKRFLPLSDKRNPKSHLAEHADADIIAAPYLVEVANRPDVLARVEAFLGCKPTISQMGVWWSYPTSIEPQQAELFHRDVDDWRFVKLFVYLTDVGPDNGPHGYVQGSAREKAFLKIGRFDEDNIRATFGDRVVSMTGAAGSAFLEDTFGLHRGTPVRSGVRLAFQVIYGLHPGPYGPRRPLARLSTGLNPSINRVYFQNDGLRRRRP